MIKPIFIAVIISLFMLISPTFQLPFSTNKMYSFVGRFNVDIESSNKALATKSWTSTYPNFTYTYPAYYLEDRVHSNIFLGDFQFNNIGSGVSCMLQLITKINGGFIFKVSSNNSQNIMKLSVNYIFYYNFKSHNTVFYIKGNIISVKQRISRDPKTFYFTTAPLPTNFSRQNVIVKTFFSGFQIKPTNKSQHLDLSVASFVNNSIGYKIVISSNSTIPTYVESLRILFIIFDSSVMQRSDINSSNFYRIFQGTALTKRTSKQLEAKVQQAANPVSFNSIVGLSAFSTTNQSTFGFWSEVTQNTFKISLNSLISLPHFAFNYVIIQSKYCDYRTPFLDITTGQCHLQCPLEIEGEQYLMCYCPQDGFLTKDGPKCFQNRRRRLIASQSLLNQLRQEQIIDYSQADETR